MAKTKAELSSDVKSSRCADSLTPAMRQYVNQKKKVGDAVLLFRMGDFYETFFDDALLCSKVLGIALTSRNKGSANPIPLAGIPFHALDGYLKKLVQAGYKVAISEQLEDPKQAKGVVDRDVVRIVTAGTLTDESLLSEHDDNILASICLRKQEAGVALVELTSGRFEVVQGSVETLFDELVRARVAELLIDDEPDSSARRVADELGQICHTVCTRRPAQEFSAYQSEQVLLEHFGVSTLSGFGFDRFDASLCAAGCLVQYLRETQKRTLTHLTTLRQRVSSDYLQIDHNSWRALEIERTIRTEGQEGTLLWAIDRTVHPIGRRMLRSWLRNGLTCIDAIVQRQEAVSYLVAHDRARGEIRRRLKSLADVERIAGRVALSRTSPRELSALGHTIEALPGMRKTLGDCCVPFLASLLNAFDGMADLADFLRGAIHDDPPATTREGGFIADGFNEELDRLRGVARTGRQWLADYQRREAKRTGLASLKVGFNRVFGYYIEVPTSAQDQVPIDYVRKQTIKNAERYITPELKQHETDVLTARDRAVELELRLLAEVCGRVAERIDALMRVADALGRLDCVAGLAQLAVERHYVQPELVEKRWLEIRDGRHPVLDQTLCDEFVPNDTVMTPSDGFVFVITGPNMAGKSTYVRQVALLALLAQTGSFVPATAMTCSVVDRIFARIGSWDEIMRGQSTFMVEMTEAANILRNATPSSLVVLDELGRGTSTFDGLSLAWAITESLAHDVQCQTLVATHYHELIELAELFRGVRNFNVAVREEPGEDVVFLHKIVEGGASKSYGIHVAKLAGLPHAVIERSREVLDELQRGLERESSKPGLARRQTRNDRQLSLFEGPPDKLAEELRNLDPDRMTPLEALQRVKEWKERFES